MRIREVASGKRKPGAPPKEPDLKNAEFLNVDPKRYTLDKDSGVRQDTNALQLGNRLEKTPVLKMYQGDGNVVKPFIQEKFDDLVGKLLDETDELDKNYQTLKHATNQNNNDPGEIGKDRRHAQLDRRRGGHRQQEAADHRGGGVARTGRQGGRRHRHGRRR